MRLTLHIIACICLLPGFSRAQAMLAELFFDTDPGKGNGISITLGNGNNIDEVINKSAADFPAGDHRVFIRLKEGNKWSHYHPLGLIRIVPAENKPVTGGEYFLNSEPGQGNGTATPFQPNQFPDVLLSLEASAFQSGRNYFYYRLTNGETWSHYHMLSFTVGRNAMNSGNIQFIDYFADDSGAPLSWTRVPVTPGSEIDHDLVIPLNDISLGEQIAFIRLADDQNGYSHYMPVGYSVCEIVEPQIEVMGDTLRSSIQSDTYQWFFNGDSIPETNTSFIIANEAGRYAVRTGSGVCTSLSLPVYYLSTGVSIVQSPKIKLYPNPAVDFMQVFIMNGASWSIIDLSGRTLLSGKNEADSFTIPLAGFKSGIYLIKLEQPGKIYQSKFVLNMN
jgi:hypothetical protein